MLCCQVSEPLGPAWQISSNENWLNPSRQQSGQGNHFWGSVWGSNCCFQRVRNSARMQDSICSRGGCERSQESSGLRCLTWDGIRLRSKASVPFLMALPTGQTGISSIPILWIRRIGRSRPPQRATASLLLPAFGRTTWWPVSSIRRRVRPLGCN